MTEAKKRVLAELDRRAMPTARPAAPSREAVASDTARLVNDLAAVVRLQNGNQHADINTLLSRADAILALFAAQPGEAKAVAVKPLEWREETVGFYWSAPSELGRYHITHFRGMRQGNVKLEYGGGLTSYFNALEAAKAAAQADYEARILSCLSTPERSDD